MTLPVAPDSISLSQINLELFKNSTDQISLNSANVRTLAGIPSGTISLNNLRGKSGIRVLNNPNASGTPAFDRFGDSVAISGNYAIVGAFQEDVSSGKAYIFNVTTGALVHTLNNPNAFGTSDSDLFGRAVAISDNYAIVGANNEDETGQSNSGKAYIFNVTTGALVRTLDNPNVFGTSDSDLFGRAVAISDNYAIVGASFEDEEGQSNSGKAYLFRL